MVSKQEIHIQGREEVLILKTGSPVKELPCMVELNITCSGMVLLSS